uniref:triacylglycerol lipase n=1 Tax=Nilaparvata lugens TaxID=108931 RepID=A0A3Q9D0J8_NILLU|nr:brummer [Nilaparvata lugens]
MNLSFAGCGFLGIYHVGVAVCFKKYAPHLLLNKISGASAGAIAACCLLCDLPIGDITTDVLNLIREARARTLGPFSPSFNVQAVLLEGLKKVLPEDAHLRVSGKLHISLTRVYDGKNVIVTQFNSKEDLLQALLASAFVPIFSGLIPPKFHGVRYIDGGFSDNLPTLDENTITVSPFCGETDICPRDFSSQLFHVNVANTSIELSKQNIHRFARILWPPKPEVLSNMCKQGFDDALRFLHRNNLISCTRCLAVQSTFVVSEILDESFEYDPQCQECKQHRQEALVANLPDTVLSLFQDAIDSANKGVINWIFKHRGMKLLSILTLPYTLPIDIIYAIFRKFIALAPHMADSLCNMCQFLIEQITHMFRHMSQRKQLVSGNVSCRLALTNYGQEPASAPVSVASTTIQPEAVSATDKPIHLKNKVNFNFTLDLEDSDLDKSGKISANKLLSRRSSYSQQNQQQQQPQTNTTTTTINNNNNNTTTTNTISSQPPTKVNDRCIMGDDTFENILQVTRHHEALMAFHYMDGDKVKVTEIFDVTEEEAKSMLESRELEIEEESTCWPQPTEQKTQEVDVPVNSYDAEDDRSLSDHSEFECQEAATIFSDPESEWLVSVADNPFRENAMPTTDYIDCRPESDQ